MSARRIAACVLLASLVLSARAQAPPPPPTLALSRDAAALLRRAVFEADLGADPIEAVSAWLAARPGLDSLTTRLRSDANLRKAILELAIRRQGWRSEPRGAFIAWWDPEESDAGLPAGDAAALTPFLDALGRELGIAVPAAIPYALVTRPGAERVRGPESLRWGIVTAHPRDREAVAKLLMLEAGNAAFVTEPLSRLRACEDRECRRALLDHARGVVIRSGYVPILDGLQAAAFAEEDDPALASALLVIDRIDRLHPGRTFTALLVALETAKGTTEQRAAFFRATGEAPSRLDKLVQAELSEWARARSDQEGGAPARRPRTGPPPRSW